MLIIIIVIISIVLDLAAWKAAKEDRFKFTTLKTCWIPGSGFYVYYKHKHTPPKRLRRLATTVEKEE